MYLQIARSTAAQKTDDLRCSGCNNGGGRISPRFGVTTAAATPQATTVSFPAGSKSGCWLKDEELGAAAKVPPRPRALVRASSSGRRDPSLSPGVAETRRRRRRISRRGSRGAAPSSGDLNLGSMRGPCFLGSFVSLGAGHLSLSSTARGETAHRSGFSLPLPSLAASPPLLPRRRAGVERRVVRLGWLADQWVRGPHPMSLACGVSWADTRNGRYMTRTGA
jgi:hypothetical protein